MDLFLVMCYNINVVKGNSQNKIKKGSDLMNIIKEKTIIRIELKEKKIITINIENGEIINSAGRSVKTLPVAVRDQEIPADYEFLIRYLKRNKTLETRAQELSILESYWTKMRMIEEIPFEKCPAGYIKYCEMNNLNINNKTLFKFKEEKRITNKINEKDIKIWFYLLDKIHELKRMNCNTEQIQILIKIFKESGKDTFHSFDIKTDFENMLNHLILANKNFSLLNPEKGAHYNSEFLEDYLQQETNKKIIKEQSRISAINDKEIDEYIIITPKDKEDLIKEGKMQNNCVGYYYNDSIINKEDLIYFIRKRNNPNKSYITCRFNLRKKITVEYRLKNNAPVTNEKENQLIKEIDVIINQILERE